MKYFAITQGAAEWFLPKVGAVDQLFRLLCNIPDSNFALRSADFFEGPIRISFDQSEDVLAVWHADYVTGTGSESWGFMRVDGVLSITDSPSTGKEVLERCLYVFNQRLQGLLIDGAMIHRSYDNGTHTLLAGRGNNAHHLSIGYFEAVSGQLGYENRAVVCVGPHESFATLSAAAEIDGRKLEMLTEIANGLLGPTRAKPLLSEKMLPELRATLSAFFEAPRQKEFEQVEIVAGGALASAYDAVRYLGLSFDQWMDVDSPLSDAKRRILMANAIDRHPLRILGPGGSGKTLLMQLLAVKKVKDVSEADGRKKILYVVHSEAMKEKVLQRFQLLAGGEGSAISEIINSSILVTTLSQYCREQLGLDLGSTLDADADSAKAFQLEQVLTSLREVAKTNSDVVKKSKVLTEVFGNEPLLKAFAMLVAVEISVAIKGHGLEGDRKRYVESERSFSLLHGHLAQAERAFIFEVFQYYHRTVFEGYSVLDPDDIALSLAGRLRTPIWQLRRKTEGFDYIFVDEAQLFNENERRIFPLLVKSEVPHIPIVLALDQAQATYGQSSAGLATIGIKDIENERLASVHRSTQSIIRLAFFVIQKSTDLFGPDFPDFTDVADNLISDDHPLAARPRIETQGSESKSIGNFVLRRVRDLRRANTRQIAVICHSEKYWATLESELSSSDLPFQVIRERGARFPYDQPLVSLCRPSMVGGQEFDAVIIVGLEAGLTPPKIADNETLATALEQQVIRETYLAITRARYRVVFVMALGSAPNSILEQATAAGLIAK